MKERCDREMAAALLSVLSGRIRRWKYIRICGGGEADSCESSEEMQNSEKYTQGNEYPA